MLQNIVIKNRYLDSVMLMSIAAKAKEVEGVNEVSAMMGTDANKEILSSAGLLDEAGRRAGPMDLVIAIDAVSEEAVGKTAAQVEEMLTRPAEEAREAPESLPRTLEAATSRLPGANLLFISLPGAYARREAEAAIDRGLHVMIFSDNVPLADEVALKKKAREKGLIVMGPDCGTAIVSGIALGFANVVRGGPIGIVGASGTGIQEVSCIISNSGRGISQAIGLGGRDLKDEVGGISMLTGIEALDADPGTRVIVLISKPPSPAVAERVLDRAKECSKPVIVNFLKGDPAEAEKRGLPFSATLEEAALKAVAALEGKEYRRPEIPEGLRERASRLKEWLSPQQKYIRGLFSGGTLTDEALLILREIVGDCYSNTPLSPEFALEDASTSVRNTLVDLGDDEFTRGRPHPMIDFTLRCERIVEEAKDPGTAVILLDVVLGYGSNGDAAAELIPAIGGAHRVAREAGRFVAFVASVTGTDADPQNRSRQVAALERVGVLVAPSNAQATRLAGMIVS